MGYPKTGTTYIQKEILSQIQSSQVLVKPKGYVLDCSNALGEFGQFFRSSPRIWRALGNDFFTTLLGPSSAQESSENLLVSDESVGIDLARSCSYAGSRGQPQFPLGSGCTPHLAGLSRIAERWKFTRVRVVVIIRRQDTWIPSAYVQEAELRENPRQEDFRDHVHALLEPRRRLYEDGIVLDYNAVTRGLYRALGEDNVLVLPFEMMKEEPTDFFVRWATFLSLSDDDIYRLKSFTERSDLTPMNVRSLTDNRWHIRREVAHLAHTGKDNFIKMTDDLSHQILSAYQTVNETLDDLIEVDLQSYGYC